MCCPSLTPEQTSTPAAGQDRLAEFEAVPWLRLARYREVVALLMGTVLFNRVETTFMDTV